MKELQELIRAAEDIKTIAGPHVSKEIVRRLDSAIAAAEEALKENTSLHLAGELAEDILVINLLHEIFEANETEETLILEPEEWKPLYEKARELKEALGG